MAELRDPKFGSSDPVPNGVGTARSSRLCLPLAGRANGAVPLPWSAEQVSKTAGV